MSQQATCVHADTPYNVPEVACGRRNFAKGSHGFLCRDHYIDEQNSIPPKPRKPRYLHVKPLSDDEVVARIKQTEALEIAEGREEERIETFSFGGHDPAVLRVLRAR